MDTYKTATDAAPKLISSNLTRENFRVALCSDASASMQTVRQSSRYWPDGRQPSRNLVTRRALVFYITYLAGLEGEELRAELQRIRSMA